MINDAQNNKTKRLDKGADTSFLPALGEDHTYIHTYTPLEPWIGREHHSCNYYSYWVEDYTVNRNERNK